MEDGAATVSDGYLAQSHHFLGMIFISLVGQTEQRIALLAAEHAGGPWFLHTKILVDGHLRSHKHLVYHYDMGDEIGYVVGLRQHQD